jgi:predicted alpha/beta-hydrolase family hydrolase
MAESGAKELTIEADGRRLSALWTDEAGSGAVAVLAHGAGAGMTHPFMEGVAGGFAAGGVGSLRFNFPYVDAGRRSPDRPPALMEAWRGALAAARDLAGSRPIAAGGKSIGGRMASMVAAEEGEAFAAAALVFFGYPLHAPGKADQPRDAHLPRVTVPMLFIQGTQDSLATFEMMERLVARLGPQARLHAVPGGDHSFRVRGARRSDADIGRQLGSLAASFVLEVAG